MKTRLCGYACALALVVAGLGASTTAASAQDVPPARLPSNARIEAVAPILGGASLKEVADAVTATAPASTMAVVAPAGDPEAIVQAVAYAAAAGRVPFVAEASADATATVSALNGLGVTHVALVAAESGFAPSFVSGLTAAFEVDTSAVSDDEFLRSLPTIDPAYRAQVVVANTAVANSLVTASAVAIAQGLPLLLLSGNEDASAVAAVVEDPNNLVLTVAGGGAALPYDVLSEEAQARILDLSVDSPIDSGLTAAFQTIADGADATHVVTGPVADIASFALASYVAKTSRSVVLPFSATNGVADASSATRYLRLIGPELESLTVVGVGVSQGTHDLLAAEAGGARNAPPAFRVVDTQLVGASFGVSYTAAPGAAVYVAYDLEGIEVGRSNSTSITVTGTPLALAIVAESSVGEPLATLQYKSNEYAASSDRQTAVVASTDGGANHMVALGDAGVPRLVTRIELDVFQIGAVPVETPIAITCQSSFTDVSLPKTLQYQYDLTTLANSAEGCGAGQSLMLDGDEARIVSGVIFPPTEYPEFKIAGSGAIGLLAAVNESAGPAATPSIVDGAILAAARGQVREGGATLSAGDDWAPVVFVYQAYIPGKKILTPGWTGDFSRRYQFFGADNRASWEPNVSYRFRHYTTFYFGAGHTVTNARTIGETIKYACRNPLPLSEGGDCVEKQRTTADVGGLQLASSASTATSGDAVVTVRASNPLHALAPPIDGRMQYRLRLGGSTIKGTHDLMPVHEVWYGVAEGDLYLAYANRLYFAGCLVGNLSPVCTAVVNVRV